MSRFKPALVIIAASGLYWLAGRIGMNLFPGFNAPAWWLAGASLPMRILTWLHLSTWAGLALMSAPIAIALVGLVNVRAVRHALLAAVLGLFLPLLFQILPHVSMMGPLGRLSTLADLLKFLVTLPLQTMLATSLWKRLYPPQNLQPLES